MKYYLEANVLWALGRRFIQNEWVLKNAFTSVFSFFEVIKSIGKKDDNEKRISAAKNLLDIDLKIINLMPEEMIAAAYGFYKDNYDYQHIYKKSYEILNNNISMITDTNNHIDYEKVVSQYENATESFQRDVKCIFVKKKPKQKIIEINDLDNYAIYIDKKECGSNTHSDERKNKHPAHQFIDHKRTEWLLYNYKLFAKKNNLENMSDDNIIAKYDGSLDLFFFSSFSYNFKKDILREEAKKHDLNDILHTVYLRDINTVMVSNDKIFKELLPNINIITVDEFKKIISTREKDTGDNN